MLIANRESFAVAARKRLPYDAEVEYLQIENSTSLPASYIDTGLVADSSLSIKAVIRRISGDGNPFMGAGMSSPTIKRYHMDVTSSQLDFYYGTNNTLYKIANSAWASPVTVEVRQSEHRLYLGTKYVAIPTTQFSTDMHFLIGLRYWVGSPQRLSVSMRYYSFAASGGGETLDLIPVRAGGLGYMYDRVSGRLYGNAGNSNAGFQASCVGPDVN